MRNNPPHWSLTPGPWSKDIHCGIKLSNAWLRRRLVSCCDSSMPCPWTCTLYPWISTSLYQGLSRLCRFIPYCRVGLQMRLNWEIGHLSSADFGFREKSCSWEEEIIYTFWVKFCVKSPSKGAEVFHFDILKESFQPNLLELHLFVCLFLKHDPFFDEKEWKRRINDHQTK